METSLHRDLKLHYAVDAESTEVTFSGFRIDAIGADGELIEVQHASLGAMRDKTRKLLRDTKQTLRIVKPIFATKRVTTLTKKDGETKRSRMSPLRCDALEIFYDLVHFSTVFPAKRLVLEIALVHAEEIRVDRARPTRRGKKFHSIDQRLVDVEETISLRTRRDLLDLLPLDALPIPFDTAELAAAIQRPRWFAQKVAYCLRVTGAAKLDGKRGNSQLYRIPRRRKQRRAA